MEDLTSRCSSSTLVSRSTWELESSFYIYLDFTYICIYVCTHIMISVRKASSSTSREKTEYLTTFLKMPRFSHVKCSSLTLSRSCERAQSHASFGNQGKSLGTLQKIPYFTPRKHWVTSFFSPQWQWGLEFSLSSFHFKESDAPTPHSDPSRNSELKAKVETWFAIKLSLL